MHTRVAEAVSWEFNHKIITARDIYCYRRPTTYRIVSSQESQLFVANALIVKVIFQLNSFVSINLRLKGHDTIQKSFHGYHGWRGRFYNLISLTHSVLLPQRLFRAAETLHVRT